MKRILLGFLILCLASAPAAADVIPTSPGAADDRAALERALTDRGVAAIDARAVASTVNAPDAAYFAAAPERVQLVGGLLFEEWAGAAIAAVGIPVATYLLLRAVDIYGD